MDIIIDTIFSYLFINLVYYVSSLILYFIDLYNTDCTNKIQSVSHPLIINMYIKCLPTVLLNTFVYSIPGIYFIVAFTNYSHFEFSYLKMMLDLGQSLLYADIFFYIFHRLLHIPFLYKYIHKKHHEMTAPIGISALYCSVLELYVGNIIPIYVPFLLLSPHKYTLYLWFFFTTLNTVIWSHSGYYPFASFHDNHHKYFNCNYGISIFMDSLMGTSVYSK